MLVEREGLKSGWIKGEFFFFFLWNFDESVRNFGGFSEESREKIGIRNLEMLCRRRNGSYK